TQAHSKIDPGIAPDGFAEDLQRPLARFELPCHQLQRRRLAVSVRAKQSGHAAANGQGHVVQPDHLSVPFGQVISDDHRRGRKGVRCRPLFRARAGHHHVTTSTARMRRLRTPMESATMPARTAAETTGGVSNRGLSLKMTYPRRMRLANTPNHDRDTLS